MEASQIYVIIAIVALTIIALLVFFKSKNKKKEKLSLLTTIAFLFIFAGILSVSVGYGRLVSYGLFGVAIIIAVIDMVMKSKKKK